ncbi:MAG: GNAT family N-acetyltransferase [Duncaniella sp.]|nr:GNAT family N-acetyltransferase [Duncaniella sp.]
MRLRALEPIDVDTLYRWENDPAVWGVGSTLAPYSRKQLWDYIDSYDGDIYAAKQLRLMIELPTGETIGTADLYDFDAANSRCAVGILIAPPYRRQGHGLAALNALADYCRTRLSLHQLYCIAGADNTASRALFERAGYSISGRLRSWLRSANTYTDAYLYQKML